MEKEYFEIYNLSPGKRELVIFGVAVRGWALNPKDQTWDIAFSIRMNLHLICYTCNKSETTANQFHTLSSRKTFFYL
ncbi:MAG: hypothetical protein AYK19_19640 [Theionarchaea archaeon DG-70-1]|nr:MAG: hypothetical protein AYK19_19640 [Theionarchaea archaeon DG-70-1]